MSLPIYKIELDRYLDEELFLEFFKNKNHMIKDFFPQIKTKKDVLDAINYSYKSLIGDIKSTVNFLKENNKKLDKIANIISDKLTCKWDEISEITIIPCVCPVCPRWIYENKFMVAYFFNRDDILRICAHEMTHLLYFKKLNILLPDEKIDTEYPSKDWLLSEIVAPLIINSPEIKKLVNGNRDTLFIPDGMISGNQIEKINNLFDKEKDILVFRKKALAILN